MTGSLIALAAKGAADTQLTYKPQQTFFKSCTKRHTNFAIERLQGQFQGQVRLGGKLIHRVSRNSDLLGRAYVVLEFQQLCDLRGNNIGDVTVNAVQTNYFSNEAAAVGNETTNPIDALGDGIRFVDCAGFLALDEARCLIGGHEFDRYNGIDGVLQEDLYSDARRRFGPLVGCFDSDNDAITFAGQISGTTQVPNNTGGIRHGICDPTAGDPTGSVRFYVPLYFWWSRLNKSMSLPLIALQYHEVQLEFRVARADQLIKFVYNQDVNGVRDVSWQSADAAAHPNAIQNTNNWSGGALLDAFLVFDGVFLDTNERKMMACKSMEYLISQHQNQDFSGTGAQTTYSHELNFNHPTQFITFYGRRECAESLGDWTDFTGFTQNNRAVDIYGNETSGASVALQFNGQNLSQPLHPIFNRLLEPADHGAYRPDLYSYTFPFGLQIVKGEDANPCIDDCPNGSVNLSRIDRTTMNIQADGTANSNNYINNQGALVQVAGTISHHYLAKNYNSMKVAAGMAGLVYAN